MHLEVNTPQVVVIHCAHRLPSLHKIIRFWCTIEQLDGFPKVLSQEFKVALEKKPLWCLAKEYSQYTHY